LFFVISLFFLLNLKYKLGNNLYRDGSSISQTSSPLSQNWRKFKSNFLNNIFKSTFKRNNILTYFLYIFEITENNDITIPVPRPRSVSSKKSAITNDSSVRSVSANSSKSNKSSVQNSRSVTPESVSIELSDSEITDSSSKIVPLKYSIHSIHKPYNLLKVF